MKPTTPQAPAGILIEPPISLPVANIVQPEANAAALPPLDPPGVISKCQGFLVTPFSFEWQNEVRENSGLAMSSINTYLSKDDREYCGKIYSCIKNMAETLKTSSVKIAKEQAFVFLQSAGFEMDYLEILDADNLSEITERTNKILIAVAVNYKKVRLIDNILVSL